MRILLFKIDTVRFLMAELGLIDSTIEIYIKSPSGRRKLAVVLHPKEFELIMQWTNHGRNDLKRKGEEANSLAGIYVLFEKILKDIESDEDALLLQGLPNE